MPASYEGGQLNMVAGGSQKAGRASVGYAGSGICNSANTCIPSVHAATPRPMSCCSPTESAKSGRRHSVARACSRVSKIMVKANPPCSVGWFWVWFLYGLE